MRGRGRQRENMPPRKLANEAEQGYLNSRQLSTFTSGFLDAVYTMTQKVSKQSQFLRFAEKIQGILIS